MSDESVIDSQPVENKVSSEAIIDLDTFMTLDKISSEWINGLMIYLAPSGGILPRSISDWRSVLNVYQGLK